MSNIKGKGHCQSCPIRHLSIFAQLPPERLPDIQLFQPTVMVYAQGETVYRQGEVAASAFTLRKGMVKLTKSLPNGRTQIIRLLGAGELFGFDGFIAEAHNHAAISLSPIEVCRLPFNELLALKRQNPEIENAMTQRWLQYLHDMEDRLVELGAKKAPERLASFLIRWYESNPMTDQGVHLPLSRGEMGDLLGLTIETVSRFLSEWRRQGYLSEHKGYIQLPDREALRKSACSVGSC